MGLCLAWAALLVALPAPCASQDARPSGTQPVAQAPTTDWRGFRGTAARATAEAPAPTQWTDSKNLAWRLKLPGPGTSSPIIVGSHVFLTCWSGYGLDAKKPGDPKQLRRHLLKVDRDTGRLVWTRTLEPAETEDPFGGRMAHGYASSTPVSDGRHIFVFFGKAGVFAYDLDGERVWHTSVGTGSSKWTTGSGSSPALWGEHLFINAADESLALIALDKASGKEVWRRNSDAFDQAYGTPIVAQGRTYPPTLLHGMLGALWGLDPRTGKPRWTAKTATNGALAPTIILGGDSLFSFGGQTKVRSHALRLGGTGDVTESHIRWKSRYGSYVTTPLFFDDHLYWVNEGGIVYCAEAKTGELVFKDRLDGTFYSSPVRAGKALYFVSRSAGTFVLQVGPEFELLNHNLIESDESNFDATPALSGGRLFLRSAKALYCVRTSGQ